MLYSEASTTTMASITTTTNTGPCTRMMQVGVDHRRQSSSSNDQAASGYTSDLRASSGVELVNVLEYDERQETIRKTMDQSTILQSGYVYRKVCKHVETEESEDESEMCDTDLSLDSTTAGCCAAACQRSTSPSSGAASTAVPGKLSKSLKTWKKRWALLRTQGIAFYKNEKEYELKELLLLDQVNQVSFVKERKRRSNMIVLSLPSNVKYLLQILPKKRHSFTWPKNGKNIDKSAKESSKPANALETNKAGPLEENGPPMNVIAPKAPSYCLCCKLSATFSTSEAAESEEKQIALQWLHHLQQNIIQKK